MTKALHFCEFQQTGKTLGRQVCLSQDFDNAQNTFSMFPLKNRSNYLSK